jgi:hypothetical protein
VEVVVQLMMKAVVTYLENGEEVTDTVEVRSSHLPMWLRDMADDIEQEGLKIVSIHTFVSGVLPAA